MNVFVILFTKLVFINACNLLSYNTVHCFHVKAPPLYAHISIAAAMECGTLTAVEEGPRPGKLAVVTSIILCCIPLYNSLPYR